MNAPSTTNTMDSTRLKRIPSYLRNKLAKLPRNSVASATSTLILNTLDSSFETDDSFSENIQSLRQLLQELTDKEQNDCASTIYDFLLYFSNIHPTHTYPDSDENIPSEYRIVTSSQHCFDVRELIKNSTITEGKLVNPINNEAFFSLDQKRIFNMCYALGIDIGSASKNAKSERIAGFDASRYKVINRKGFIIDFSESEISNAITEAMNQVYTGTSEAEKNEKSEKVKFITFSVINSIKKAYPAGAFIHIETIQNFVEQALMDKNEGNVARKYIIYRNERTIQREKSNSSYEPTIRILLPSGDTSQLDLEGLKTFLIDIAEGLNGINIDNIISETYRALYDKIPYSQVNDALVLTARTKIEANPEYSMFASRLLKHKLCEEVISTFEEKPIQIKQASFDYSPIFSQYITKGVENELLSPKLLEFDLPRLEKAIQCNSDNLLTYLSLQTLYDRYFIHHKGNKIELPQFFFMRIAMGLCIEEKEGREEKAIEFYQLLSSLSYMCSTPTLFNSGTNRPQLSSCFLTTIPDSLEGILDGAKKNGQLAKYSGGIGNDWTNIRSNGSRIKGTNGVSSGMIPFANLFDALTCAVNQGGKRDGAVCAYLEAWHGDVMDFLDLRKNTGDDRRRTHDMNTAIWLPDLFMQRVFEKKSWTLFSPSDVPGLHDAYGEKFEKLYTQYEAQAAEGSIPGKQIDAITLWRKILSMLFETGHPWITFKDPCNIRSPQQHAGVIHSSNLCTEITLNTSEDETAVCNLGSINLLKHVDIQSKAINQDKLRNTIKLAVRMLDNVVDINYYSTECARRSNLRHRPVGLGMMGLQDTLYALGISMESEEAIEFSDKIMEIISYHAIEASVELARERGAYPSYEGSLWSQNILPIDSLKLLQKTRGDYLDVDTSSQLDWTPVREKLKHFGIRNSNLLAIAPTATISNICNVSQSIEPTYLNLSVKSNMSGEFTVVNPFLINELKAHKMWNESLLGKLKASDGSLQNIAEIPADIRARYKTAFEIDVTWLIKAASRRQKWIDQSQSLNLYMAQPSGRELDILYKSAWIHGLKTTYYLRSLGATSTEKSTYDDGKLNAVQRPAQCSIDDPSCEACQ